MKKVQAFETMEGDGALVYRLMPVAGLRNFDPFVLFDHFVLQAGMGFPTHPHRGFEGITYLLSGSMQHKDNLGNDRTIQAGGAQRFTAGSGIFHSEMPSETEITEGIQLWVNLPKKLKTLAPDYQQVGKEEIIIDFPETGVQRRTLVGDKGKIKTHQAVSYEDYSMEKGASILIENSESRNQLIYLLKGELRYTGNRLSAKQALLIDQAQKLELTADKESRLIVLSGEAIGEPIYQHGPYVD